MDATASDESDATKSVLLATNARQQDGPAKATPLLSSGRLR